MDTTKDINPAAIDLETVAGEDRILAAGTTASPCVAEVLLEAWHVTVQSVGSLPSPPLLAVHGR